MEDEVMEPGTEEMDFSAFMDGESDTPAETEPEAEETTGDTEPGAQTDETTEDDGGEDGSETEANSGDDRTEDAGSYTIKVNGAEKTVAKEEVIPLLQKGSDYDRVRQQRDEKAEEVARLQKYINDGAELNSMLSLIAKDTGMEMLEVAENLYINLQKSKGISEDTAKANLKAERLEKQLSELQSEKNGEQAQQERVNREVTEFRQNFPNVEITEELAEKLMADVQGGMSLSDAYRKMQSAEKDAEIQRLKEELAASKKNKANKASSTGSMKDSGGKTRRDSFDDFMAMIT